MIHDLPGSSRNIADSEAFSFRIVAIYDSAESSLEAARASAVVMRELGEDVAVDKSSWPLDALGEATICAKAAAAAAKADMVIIALTNSATLDGLKSWIADWEKRRELGTGLLTWIPASPDASANGLEEFLYETAVTAQMDFLCPRHPRY